MIKTLESYYQSFINQGENWDFFLGLAEYVEVIIDTPELKKIVDKALEEKTKEYKKLEEFENRSLNELKISKKKLLKVISDNKIVSAELSEKMQDLKDFENGKINRGGLTSKNIDGYLWSIARTIYEQPKYKHLIEKFVDKNPAIKNIYGNFIFSKTLGITVRQKSTIEEKKRTEIWGAFDFLIKAYKAVLEDGEKIENELSQKQKLTWEEIDDGVDLIRAIRDIKTIKPRGELKGLVSENNVTFLRKDVFKNFARRVHNHLLRGLTISEKKENLKKETIGAKKQKKIEILEVVRPRDETNKFNVVVNNNYLNPLLGDKAKPSWDMLFRVATGENLEGKGHKSSLEYFNTNKNCKLYTQTGCSLTKIFKTEYYIKPAITIKMIGDKAYKQRAKAQKDRKAT